MTLKSVVKDLAFKKQHERKESVTRKDFPTLEVQTGVSKPLKALQKASNVTSPKTAGYSKKIAAPPSVRRVSNN